ncbi:hypothetical protein SDC9_212307 [bioreactor metagenome]|uniref:UDP-glucose/GDP-mannose dehydrogenase C-terminal domain-containing protein n=1 Tax=bioreactor metagenome TaxID=1076179 RepID=A0A645JMK7_9ZZZZ
MIRRNILINGAEVLVLGITFKENCNDVRNSHAVDVVRGLEEFGCRVTVCDPWADGEEVRREYGIESVGRIPDGMKYDAIVLTVAHREFTDLDPAEYRKDNAVVFDIKGLWPRTLVDGRL